MLPGMEITTKEEVHLLGYFDSVDTALRFGEELKNHLPKKKNNPRFFGRQLVMNEEDEILDEEEALLIGATDLPLKAAAEMVLSFDGVPVPAHINRGSNGLLVNLGLMPSEPFYTTVEAARHLLCEESALRGRHVLHSSDAHYLGDIQEREHALQLREGTVEEVLRWMRSKK